MIFFLFYRGTSHLYAGEHLTCMQGNISPVCKGETHLYAGESLPFLCMRNTLQPPEKCIIKMINLLFYNLLTLSVHFIALENTLLLLIRHKGYEMIMKMANA